MRPELIKRRLNRINATIHARNSYATAYDVFLFPGGRVVAVRTVDDIKQYEAQNKAVFMDMLIHSPEPGEIATPPAMMDLTEDTQKNESRIYCRALENWRKRWGENAEGSI